MTVIWNMAICIKICIHQINLIKIKKRNMSKISAANLVKDFEFSIETELKSLKGKKNAAASLLMTESLERYEKIRRLAKARNNSQMVLLTNT